MTENEMTLNPRLLPNIGIIDGRLPKSVIDSLWKLVDESKKNPKNMRDQLVGNISSSISLDVKSPIISDFKTQVLPKYIDLMIEKFGLQVDVKKADKYKNWALDGLWVNFQKKHEFNPPHNHYGVYSFVIWMYVPTSYQEQRKLPIALCTNDDGSISNFCFNYTDIVGKMRMFNYEMEKDVVGTMVFFPSQLHHQVFPFFENDEERVSISGNVTIR